MRERERERERFTGRREDWTDLSKFQSPLTVLIFQFIFLKKNCLLLICFLFDFCVFFGCSWKGQHSGGAGGEFGWLVQMGWAGLRGTQLKCPPIWNIPVV
jgi:hypothetical protein